MNYVLSERGAAWLRRQMAIANGYKPAAAAPSRLVRRAGAAAVSEKSLYPLQVRFIPSDDQEAEIGDGDFVIYVPAGSVVVNGTSLRSDDVPLSPYDVGGYADRPGWYYLPQMADGDSVVLGILYDPEDSDSPLSVDIYSGEPTDVDPDDGTVEREVIVANVSITQPGDGTAGGVRIFQIAEGPLVMEVGVETLNGAMGNLAVVGGKDGMTVVEGEKYWVKVERDDGSSEIKVSLTDARPDDDGDDGEDGYCNDISDDGTDDGTGNEISGYGDGGGGGGVQGGNEISHWPCKKGEEL